MAEQGILVEEVHAPNGGLVDTIQLDLLRGSDAQVMQNFHHDRLALERRQGMTQVGNPMPDLINYGGFHYRQINGNSFIVAVQGGNFDPGPSGIDPGPLYLYKGTGSSWQGAESLATAATAADIIGRGQANGFGTFVQYADKLYWYDAGILHRLFNGATIEDYGVFAGATLPAGTLAAGGGNGGAQNYSLVLNGSTYASCGVTGINGATDYTFSVWMKVAALYSTQAGLIWAWFSTASAHNAGLSINGGGANRELLESFEGASYTKAVSQLVANDGNWHLVSGVRSGNQGQIYLDGALVQTVIFPSSALQATVLYIGCRRLDGAPTNILTGSLEDARFYARALSSGEISSLYGGVEPDATALKGWWKMNEGSGSALTDSSGVGNNGAITGTATWAIDSPNPTIGGGNTGQLQEGDYSFVYTYYNPITAEESPPSEPSNVVTLGAANGILEATVPANAAWTLALGFTVIRFYRTTANGAAYLFDHEISVSALPVTEELSIADENLGAEVQFSRGEIPRLQYCILFNEMVVGAGDPENPSRLYWSEIADPTHWPPENAQDIDRDNGDRITGIFRLLGRLYVLKQTSGVYMLTPQFDSVGTVSFTVDAVTNDFGCLSHHSIVVIDTYAYWADAKGICRFNGQQVENISDPKIRFKWKGLVAAAGSVAQQYTGAAARNLGYKAPGLETAAAHDRQADHNYYRITIADGEASYSPSDGSALFSGSRIDLIYDLSIGCWFVDRGPGPTTGRTHRTSWLIKDANGQYHVLQGDTTGRVFRLRSTIDGTATYNDIATPIVTQWKSKWWGGMDGVVPLYLEIEYERSDIGYATGPVTINLYRDGKTAADVPDTTTFVPYAANSPPPPRDSTLPDPTRLTHTCRVDWDAEWCRRFAFEILCSALNTQIRILQFRIGYQACGPMLKAR